MAKAKRKATKPVARSKTARKGAGPASRRVKPIPDGYRVVTPYLCVDGAAAAIDFYKRAFGARQRMRMDAPGGKVGHAELVLGDSVIMLADEYPDFDFRGPKSRGGTSVTIHIYVRDVDAVVARAVEAGARVKRPVRNEFYGDRTGSVEDPFGHVWNVSTHIEDLTPAAMRRRMDEAMKQAGG